MPYRRLPKTDAARLKALKTLLQNDDIYTVRNRFINWQTLSKAQNLYNQLLTASEQYKMAYTSQTHDSQKIDKLKARATMYVSHFLQVLLMAVERGEIKPALLKLYGMEENATAIPNIKTTDGLLEWGKKTVEGEKARLKAGGRPIYNPTIGMVSTHLDIFAETVKRKRMLMARTQNFGKAVEKIRPETDEVLLDLWNQIEAHFADLPPEKRFNECRKLGVVYYYRRNEEHLY